MRTAFGQLLGEQVTKMEQKILLLVLLMIWSNAGDGWYFSILYFLEEVPLELISNVFFPFCF